MENGFVVMQHGWTGVMGVYLIRHSSGVVYVGSSLDVGGRKSGHLSMLRNNQHSNQRLQEAYNRDPNVVFYARATDTRDEAYNLEGELIRKYVSAGEGVNQLMDPRSPKGVKLTLEHRMAVSLGNLGKEVSPETRLLIAGSKLGVPRPQYVVDKIRAARTGSVATEETKAKMSAARKGMTLPPRTQDHIDKIQKAKEGFKHSPESIEKLRENASNSRKVSVEGIVYRSASDVARAFGIDHKTVRTRLNGDKYPNWFYI